MNDIKPLLEMDLKQLMFGIAALVAFLVWVIQKWDFLVSKLGIKTKRAIKEEEQDNDIKVLKEHAQKTDENIDKILKGMQELQDSVQGVSNQVRSLQEKNDMNEAARLKDRIAQGYRYWHERGKWTRRDKESMEDMIKAYSQYSENSFVHSVVEKEMPQLEVVDD